MRAFWRWFGPVGLLTALLLAVGSARAAPDCRFQLGFQMLHDLIPKVVGDCLENEWHNAENGDGLQRTSGGLLVWRKADNWTAFTDGYTTWLNGPFGLQRRLNSERFSWEQAERPRQIQVFFSRRPESEQDFRAVFPFERIAAEAGVAAAALEALIAGPTAAERAAGYFSELGPMLSGPSSCGGSDFRLQIETGLAVVQFCQLVQSAGVGQDARVQAQLEATLQQFPTVQRVRLLGRDGQCLFDQSGLNRCLSDSGP